MTRAERLTRLLILLLAVGSLPHSRALPLGRAAACAPCAGQQVVRLEPFVRGGQPIATLHEGASAALSAVARASETPAGLPARGTTLPLPSGTSWLRNVLPPTRAGLARHSSAVRGPPFSL
jgi:hypothetical protein